MNANAPATLKQEQLDELKSHCATWFKLKSEQALVKSVPALIAMAEKAIRYEAFIELVAEQNTYEECDDDQLEGVSWEDGFDDLVLQARQALKGETE